MVNIKNFTLSTGEYSAVTMPIHGTEIDRVYLAGKSARKATLAVASLSDGKLNTFSTILVKFDI